MRLYRYVWAALAMAAQALAAPGPSGPVGYENDVRTYNLAHGRVVFSERCMRCHESGRKGAPVFGDAADWKARVRQPLDTLIEHALTGHGRMPPRGDQLISDQDVAAAVAYVVNRARVIVAVEDGELPPPATGPEGSQNDDTADQAVLQMLLLLLERDRWK
ncbi:MAG: c-type cytochrome [Gammaproteobacteria bacterium]|nr:c-type cytochrome [Gammaproteobacteria bacterium]